MGTYGRHGIIVFGSTLFSIVVFSCMAAILVALVKSQQEGAGSSKVFLGFFGGGIIFFIVAYLS